MKWCPKCQHLVIPIRHKYYDEKRRLIRIETVCNECHITIEVEHYGHTKEWEAASDV